MNFIFQDWTANRHNIKGRVVMVMFRLAHFATRNRLAFVLWIPYLVFYRVLVEWLLCIEVPYKVKIGRSFQLFHGQSLVINDGTRIGSNCIFRHSTTIGSKKKADGTYSICPTIGDNVDVGSNVCIIGPIEIGHNVIIGAGSVVVKDVPDNCIVVGNPARVIKMI